MYARLHGRRATPAAHFGSRSFCIAKTHFAFGRFDVARRGLTCVSNGCCDAKEARRRIAGFRKLSQPIDSRIESNWPVRIPIEPPFERSAREGFSAMRTWVWLFAPFFLAAIPASAEIFKCAGKGVVVYQNFPCDVDSLGSLPSAPARSSSAIDSNKAKSIAVSLASSSEGPTEPRIGMSADEVRAIWGEPTDTFNEEPRDGGRTETWVYGPDRSVRFDHRSRVIALQKQGG